jgi:hypothetical protein
MVGGWPVDRVMEKSMGAGHASSLALLGNVGARDVGLA